MEISYLCLLKFLPDLPSPEQVGEILTACGLEVEFIHPLPAVKGGLENMVVGQVKQLEKHPDADKLSVCQVDTGANGVLQIVCGASNVAAGQSVLVALPGAVIYPEGEESFKIKKSKIRGIESNGMICSAFELGLSKDHSGIMVLETEYKAGTSGAEALQLKTDYIFSIGLTPNRADAASHLGVARDLSAILNQQIQYPDAVFSDDNKRSLAKTELTRVRLEAPETCGHYRLQRIEEVQGITLSKDLKHMLSACGISSIHPLVDITNYMLLGYGQPMHAFDADRVSGDIVVRYAIPGEIFISLSGASLPLEPDDLIIADEKGPIALAGVIGGQRTAVHENTRNILLETAWFHPDAVRKSARNHQIHTDASFRFSRGTNPDAVAYMQSIACELFTQSGSGKICGEAQEVLGLKPRSAIIHFSMSDFHRLSGIQPEVKTVLDILQALEIQVREIGEDTYEARVPAYRVDVLRPQDLYEDILRIYGYDKVPVSGKMPASPVYALQDREMALRNLLSDQFAAKGFYEILTNSLVPAKAAGEEGVHMKNPLSEEHAALRTSMLPSGLEVLAYNRNRKIQDLRFFEWGKVYFPSETGFQEKLMLAVWMSGNRREEHWREETAGVDIFSLSSLVEWLNSGLQQSLEIRTASPDDFEYGFNLFLGKENIGRYGHVKESLCSAYDYNAPVYYLEIEWKALYKATGKKTVEYSDLPKFPSVRRDISLWVPEGVQWKTLQDCIYITDPGLIQSVFLFDVYTAKSELGGKTSYSIGITLQDMKNTLQEARIDKVMEKILKNIQEKTGAVLRDN